MHTVAVYQVFSPRRSEYIRSFAPFRFIRGRGEISPMHARFSYEPSIDTVRQLAERNLQWGGTHDAWIFSILEAREVLPRTFIVTVVDYC